MLTQRDREVISFIDKIGYATIQNIADLYFTSNKFAYDLARKRLKKIKDMGDYIKCFQNSETNEIVYVPYNSTKKKVSIHNIMILNYACKLKTLGCNIEQIELEPIFENIKPDCYIQFTFNNYRFYHLIEMQIRHSAIDLERYNNKNVIDSILSKTNNIMPKLVIIQDTQTDYNKDNPTQLDIVQLDTSMEDIAKVIME